MDTNDKINTERVTDVETSQETSQKKEDVSSQHRHRHHHERHHHSDHSRSHGHRKHHRSRSQNQKKKLSDKQKQVIMITCIAVLACMLLVAIFADFSGYRWIDADKSGEISSDVLQVEIVNGNAVLVSDAIQSYLSVDILAAQNANVLPKDFANSGERLDCQIPISFKLSVNGATAVGYQIELADNDLFENAHVGMLNAASGTYVLEHLFANMRYFYRITAYTTTGVVYVTGKFETADTPRILSIDGISNVRDIGNWKTDSGKRIKQGLLIRGTEMDGAVEHIYHLTDKGLVDMLEIYGIKTDMDLRAETFGSRDALGSRVKHTYYDMVMYEGIFNEEGKEKVRRVFAELAEPDNYPIYMHCTYGCDRTGTICYLLEALLGVSRGDCIKEYGLSNMNIQNILSVEQGLTAYGGETLKENAERYLMDCGISQMQIQSIRQIFLGD